MEKRVNNRKIRALGAWLDCPAGAGSENRASVVGATFLIAKNENHK
jgi:hypothetical protein